MATDSKTVGWWTFDQTIEDSASTHDLESSELPTYTKHTRFDFTSLKKKSFYGVNLDSNSFSTTTGSLFTGSVYRVGIGFWYYSPIALGQTKHQTTRELTPKILPIIAKATTEVDIGLGNFEEIVRGEFIISEIGISETQNAIQVILINRQLSHQPVRAIFVSNSYDPGLNHVFVTINYSSSRNYLRIDINGVIGDQYNAASDFITLSNTSSQLTINSVNYGYESHKSDDNKNRFISDLILRKDASTLAMQTFQMINYGAEHVANSTVIEPEAQTGSVYHDFIGFGYKQPETVSTTSLVTNNSHIITGRSNGDLYLGKRPIWDNEIEFSKPESLNKINLSKNGDSEITSDGLKISKTIIRL